jgi:hypothetical protein
LAVHSEKRSVEVEQDGAEHIAVATLPRPNGNAVERMVVTSEEQICGGLISNLLNLLSLWCSFVPPLPFSNVVHEIYKDIPEFFVILSWLGVH